MHRRIWPMVLRNSRDLSKSNAHFRKALKRLPLGVASTFRYWGDERTIYVHHGKGGRTWDIDGNCYVDYRLGYGPAILGYADDRVDAAAREGHGGRRRLCSLDRARADRRRPHREDGAGGRSRPLLQQRHGGGDGGAAPRARLYRQGQLHPDRGQLPRAVRRGHVDGQHGRLGSAAAGSSRRRCPIPRAFRSGSRISSISRR